KLLAAGGIGKIGNIDHLDGPARVEIFDWEKGERTHELQASKGMVNALAFDPAGDWIMAAGGPSEFVLFFDLYGKKVLHEAKSKVFTPAAVFDDATHTLYLAGHNKLVVMEMKS